MRIEVIECAGEWIVRSEDHEVGRFADQQKALRAVTERWRGADASELASLSMRYENRAA